MNPKPMHDEPISYEEIKFIALPSARNLRDAGASEEQIRVYQSRQWTIVRAQRACAVTAVSVLRPDDYRMHNQKYRSICQKAREERDRALLDVFSETCTKGL